MGCVNGIINNFHCLKKEKIVEKIEFFHSFCVNMTTTTDKATWKMTGMNGSTTSLESTAKLLPDNANNYVTLRSSTATATNNYNSTILSGFNNSYNNSNSTNGYTSNYNYNHTNSIITRCCCHVLNGVQRNIRRCVTALVIISLFSIIFFTQYMDSQTIAR